ncbi:MAG TPA: hypothetical protein VMT54_13560, partial [Candidatus Cybelea sp.]|nr:hypothetical protein [Candidatus Cybelea sp.]
MAPRLSFSLVLLGGILLAGCEEMSTTGPSSIPSQNADADGLETALIPASAPQKTFLAYITGYTYWTNAPASSTAIAMPVIHRSAGGQGTYADPITLAVGRSKTGGKIKPDVPAG